MKRQVTISIIILAFNEENHLPACLDSIAAQTVMPDEVIVVNNNSTDNTVAVARSYPFVRVVDEHTQGMIPARNKGFGVATGDILARIDADTRLDPSWVERLHEDYADSGVSAVGGVAWAPFVPEVYGIMTTFWSRMYLLWMRWQFNVPILWGPNMSLRREAWLTIRSDVCMDDKLVHEDQDISVLLAKHGLKVVIDNHLVVTIDVVVTKYAEYVRRMLWTQRYHQRKGSFATAQKQFNVAQRVGFVFGIFIPIKLLFFVVFVAGMCALLGKKIGAYVSSGALTRPTKG